MHWHFGFSPFHCIVTFGTLNSSKHNHNGNSSSHIAPSSNWSPPSSSSQVSSSSSLPSSPLASPAHTSVITSAFFSQNVSLASLSMWQIIQCTMAVASSSYHMHSIVVRLQGYLSQCFCLLFIGLLCFLKNLLPQKFMRVRNPKGPNKGWKSKNKFRWPLSISLSYFSTN